MPFKEHMHWDASKKRWHKMYHGVMYRIVASELGQVHTRDATRAAANEWWLRKRSSLDGPPQRDEAAEYVESILDGPPSEEAAEAHELIDEAMTGIIGVQSHKRLAEAVQHGLSRTAKVTERSVKATAELFLQVVKGDVKPRSYRELLQYFHSLHAAGGPLKPDDDVAVLNEDQVERMYLALKNGTLSPATKKKRWGFFRRYVRYLWSKKLIDLPRNLDSYAFAVKAKKIKTYTVAEIRKCLGTLKPRLKLYALLGLNCSMTNVDIGQLQKDQIDLTAGTLTRRRQKTGDSDHKDVPTVVYALWPETVQLLRSCWSEDDTLALTSSDNTPLWSTVYEGDRTRSKDLVGKQWKKKKVPIPLKAFRSIASTLLGGHKEYGRDDVVTLFLANSPRSIKDRHYQAPAQEVLSEALTWLRGRVFT